MLTNNETNQPGDPSASLLSTSLLHLSKILILIFC